MLAGSFVFLAFLAEGAGVEDRGLSSTAFALRFFDDFAADWGVSCFAGWYGDDEGAGDDDDDKEEVDTIDEVSVGVWSGPDASVLLRFFARLLTSRYLNGVESDPPPAGVLPLLPAFFLFDNEEGGVGVGVGVDVAAAATDASVGVDEAGVDGCDLLCSSPSAPFFVLFSTRGVVGVGEATLGVAMNDAPACFSVCARATDCTISLLERGESVNQR